MRGLTAIGPTADPPPVLARRLWEAIEPIHALVYFAPEPAQAAKSIGLRGWWMGYFAGRVAPLGAVPAQAVTAVVYGFAPAMVARAIPDAWSFANPAKVVETRIAAAAEALRSRLDDLAARALPQLDDLLWDAAGACRFDGRPLGAAWSAIPRPADAAAAVWLATTILREHRGDGHVLAAVAAGLRGIDAAVTHVARGAVTRELMQGNRGWSDDEWVDSVERLQTRGLLDGSRFTEAGAALRRDVELTTDRLAAAPVELLGETAVERLIDLAAPISRQLIDAGIVPVPNPIGAPRP